MSSANVGVLLVGGVKCESAVRSFGGTIRIVGTNAEPQRIGSSAAGAGCIGGGQNVVQPYGIVIVAHGGINRPRTGGETALSFAASRISAGVRITVIGFKGSRDGASGKCGINPVDDADIVVVGGGIVVKATLIA